MKIEQISDEKRLVDRVIYDRDIWRDKVVVDDDDDDDRSTFLAEDLTRENPIGG